MLPEATRTRCVEQLESNRVVNATHQDAPGRNMVVAGLFEMGDAAEAEHYVQAARTLLEIKEATFTEGAVVIEEMRRRELEGDGLSGFLARQRIYLELLDQRTEVIVLIASRGRLAVELMYSNEPIRDELLENLARELLDAAVPLPPPAEDG